MKALKNSRKWIWLVRHQPWFVRALIALLSLIAAAAAMTAPAEASPIDDAFLGALQNAGVNYGDPGNAVAMGQSVCPMLARRGGTVAAAASSIRGSSGMSAGMADMFTTIAIQMYCPSMMASLENGKIPNVPQLPGMPGL